MLFSVTLNPSQIFFAVLIALVIFILGFAVGKLSSRVTSEIGFKSLFRPARWEGKRASNTERGRLQTIYTLISSLTATLNYQRVMELALDLSASALGTSNSVEDRLVSAVLLFTPPIEGQQAHLTVAAARRFTPADMRSVLPGNQGLLGQAFEEGKPVTTTKVFDDPELDRFVALRACNIAYCIPLRQGLNNYGVLLYAHPESNYFTPSRREIIGIVAHQTVIAIQNALLYRDLEQEKERMMEIHEDARKKLARDLHDGPTQSVAAISMRINFARRLIERDVKAAAEELQKIEELSRRTTGEIRHMLFTLRPLVLESQGLVPALEAMAEKMHEIYDQNVIVNAETDTVFALELGKQAIIFFIAEEAVTNARKHAQANHVWVRLKLVDEGLFLLEVEDDGIGFNVGAVDSTYKKRGSLGLVNIRERTELINGISHIDSAEGKGTRLQVFIPMDDEAAERLRRGE